MLNILSWACALVSALLCIPTITLMIEILFAELPKAESSKESGSRDDLGQVAIVIPAHDESAGLVPTLDDLRPQLNSGDRLIVVADNCSDDTAAIAASAGAEVVQRDDPNL